MGCMFFGWGFILSGLFYMLVGGWAVDYIMKLRNVSGLDAHDAVMTYFFYWMPTLSFVTALFLTFLAMKWDNKMKKNQANPYSEHNQGIK